MGLNSFLFPKFEYYIFKKFQNGRGDDTVYDSGIKFRNFLMFFFYLFVAYLVVFSLYLAITMKRKKN